MYNIYNNVYRILDTFSMHELGATFAVSFTAMLVGYMQAFTGNSQPTLVDSKFLPDQENIISLKIILPVMSIISAFLGGFVIEKYGRQHIIYLQSYGYFISLMVLAEAQTLTRVLIGRAICGFCIGFTVLGITIYLAEILNMESRGALSIIPMIFTEVAKIVFYCFQKIGNWYLITYVPSVLGPLSLVTLIFVPDSPRWYILHKKETQKAEYALSWLRVSFLDAHNEFRDILDMDNSNTNVSYLSELFKVTNVTVITISLILIQQILSFFQYKNITGVSINAHLLLNSTLVIIGLIICMIFIDTKGRKVLLVISCTLTSTFAIIIIIIYYNFRFSTPILLFVYILYKLSLSVGLTPIPFILMSEMLPQKFRCLSCSITLVTYFCCDFLLRCHLLSPINSEINIGFAHGVVSFSIIGLVSSLLIIYFVPNTRSKSLEDIEIETMRQ